MIFGDDEIENPIRWEAEAVRVLNGLNGLNAHLPQLYKPHPVLQFFRFDYQRHSLVPSD
jgi:hypothetical protein